MARPSQSGDRWQRLWDLFHQAAERTPSERGTYLDAACGSDRELRREVGELLAADAASHSPLDRPAVASPAADGEDLPATDVRAFASGEVLVDRFEIVRVLGHGGMGTVYEAADRELGTAVALKTLRPGLAADKQARQRFRREINLARQVTHQNVCRLFDIVRHVERRQGQDFERLFLSMELLRGETLAERLQRQGRMDTSETLPIVEQIAAGLDAAHQTGIVHRDLKPANIMLVPGSGGLRAVITDYGLARTLVTEDSSLRQTRAGQLLGTPAYMAPEQMEDGPITAATDVYALGVLLYEMLTGKLPFEGKSAISAAVQKLHRPAPSPRELLPDLDRRWESAILRCLERDPADRFQSALEVAEVLASDGSVDVPRRARASRRRLVWVGVAAALLAALALVVGPRLFPPADPGSVPAGAESEAEATVWALITRFENRTGEPIFDGAVEYALERELNQSRVVTVVPRERIGDVLRLMDRPPETPIDATLGREIALRDGGIGVILRGRVEKLGASYVLSVDVVEPGEGHSLVSLSEEASSLDEVLPALRRLASSVRVGLGEKRSRIRAGEAELSRVKTSSLRALQLFTQADREFSTQDFAVAEELLRQVIVEDPEFASAYIYLAWAILNRLGPPEEVLHFSEKAYELSEGTPTRERFFIRAGYQEIREEWAKALNSYETLVRLHPDHTWGVRQLVGLLRRLHRQSEAAQHRALLSDLRPKSVLEATFAAHALVMWRNDLAAARPYVDRALALIESGPSPPADWRVAAWPQLFSFHERWMQGDLDGALVVFHRVRESIEAEPGSVWVEASAAMALGRLADARDLLETHPSAFEDFEDLVFATLLDDQAKLAQFREVPYESEANPSWEVLRLVQLAHSGFGEENGRLALAEMERWDSNKRRALEVRNLDNRREIVRGEIALGAGRVEEAIERLRPAVRRERSTGSFYYFLGSLSLARALEQRGEIEAATAVLEDVRQQKGRVYRQFFNTGALWLRALSRLVDLHRAMGNEEAAAERETELRAHLRLADADHPLLVRLAASASRSFDG